MKFSKWRETVELITLLAVLGGLVSVVIELRKTQEAIIAQAYQTRALDAMDISFAMIHDYEFRAVLRGYESGDTSLESLDDKQRGMLNSWCFLLRKDADYEYYQFEKGFRDPDFYVTTTVPDIKKNAPHWRAFGIREPRQSFREEVERILADESIRPG